jgi:Xaa-Pro aminopeptidase
MPSTFFSNNRKKIKLEAGQVAIFTSNDPLPTNADGSAGFYQNSNFFYFSGIDQEDSYLIIHPFARLDSEREVLFVRETSENIKVWEGQKLSKAEASALSGIDNVKWSSEFWPYLERISKQIKVFAIHHDNLQGHGSAFRSRERLLHSQLKRKFSGILHKNISSILHNFRLIKEPVEIEYIRKAIEITRKGFLDVLKTIKPDLMEYEIEALLGYHFIAAGCKGHAFEPIMASGGNACILHYVQNDKKLKKGDLILMDFGANYANYKSDITRVVPVDGKFSDRQTEIYDIVYDIFSKIKLNMVPGNTIATLKKETQFLVGQGLVKAKVISLSKLKSDPKIILKYFPHGLTHHLGLDVHDVGDRDIPLSANMVMTCEPGIYIEEESIGIRLENDILITKNGNEDLMENIPLERSLIEKLMA